MKRITLTTKEVANLLGVSRATIYTMVREKEIPFFRVRGKILFNETAIISWIEGKDDEKAG